MITTNKQPNLKKFEVNFWIRPKANEEWKSKIEIVYTDESIDKIKEYYLNKGSFGKISVNSIKELKK